MTLRRSVNAVIRSGRMFGLVTLLSLASLAMGWGPGDSPVADAAMDGDVRAVETLLNQGADVNAAQGDGMTALHWAARNGDLSLTGLLLESGASLTSTTRLGAYTPLHLASQAGSGGVVTALLEAGADPKLMTNLVGAAQPLHYAAASGSVEAVTALLDNGADVNAREASRGQTPLMFAVARDRRGVVDVLVQRGAELELTTTVVDVAERAQTDRSDRSARNQRMNAPPPEQTATAEARAAGEAATPDEQAAKEAEAKEALAKQAATDAAQRQIEEPEPLSYAELVGGQGGLTALLHAVREGHRELALSLVEAGADPNLASKGDGTSPMLMAMINGHFDLALDLMERGADPTVASDAGNTPLYAVINSHWAPKSRYPQQHANQQQAATFMVVMQALLDKGADPNARLTKHLWYMSYNFDLLQVDTRGATPFWRAAYALDVKAMELLMAHGADPNIPTEKVPERSFGRQADTTDYSGLPPVPVGGPAVFPIHAASGVGYGQGFAANAHRHVPDGWVPAVRYLVETLGADVNERDYNGYAPLHHAASRGDTELIQYLVDHGADPTLVSREGQTTVDMANGPYQRTQPYPEAVALLESLGVKNNHNCVSC